MNRIFIVYILVSICIGCNTNNQKNPDAKWKNEIMETESDFAKMAAEVGISEAFLEYAADDAVLFRNGKLVTGKEEIKKYFGAAENPKNKIGLTWKPDFVEVATSGDLGYTYGKYTITSTDSTGVENSSQGIFHTVWKRQEDGSWKFVWD